MLSLSNVVSQLSRRPVTRPGRTRAASRVAGPGPGLVIPFVLSLPFITPVPTLAQQTASGTMHVVWDGDVPMTYHVVDRSGMGRQLVVDDAESAAVRYLGLDRQAVDVRGASVSEAGVIDGLRAASVQAVARVTADVSGVTRDARDFVTLLCRFADDAEPFASEQVASVHGAQYPGVRHYFAELAWDPFLMAGSRVTDWYVLPKPRADYVSDKVTDFGALARDCTAAADDDIDFTSFFGINLQFSGGLSRRLVQPYDTMSFGGSWTLTLDGATRSWGMTWLSAGHATTRAVVTHEMGHALGWPHSSGGNGSEYDSAWDVMSRGYLRWEPPYGWLSVHTIAQHKDAAGWVPTHRRWAPAEGSLERGVIVPTAQPPEDGYLFARVPAGDSHYTVEVRRQAGHDRPLPGHAALIHHVQFGMAKVVTADGDSDPNGHGAQWLPGEEFHDAARGVSVRIDSAADDGFHVSITRGWRLDITADGPGRIIARAADASTSCDSTCNLVSPGRGVRVQLEPAPALAASFSHWTGACASSGAVCEVTLDRNRTVTAVFVGASVASETLLAPAIVGETFEAVLPSPDQTTATEWQIVAGDLPEGIHFDARGRVVRGVAIESGTFTFSVAVATGGASGAQRYRLEVAPPALSAGEVVDHLLGGGPLRQAYIQYFDHAGNRNGRLDIGDLRRWLLEQVQAGAFTMQGARALRQLMGTKQ